MNRGEHGERTHQNQANESHFLFQRTKQTMRHFLETHFSIQMKEQYEKGNYFDGQRKELKLKVVRDKSN